jgi:hypothetical protein
MSTLGLVGLAVIVLVGQWVLDVRPRSTPEKRCLRGQRLSRRL